MKSFLVDPAIVDISPNGKSSLLTEYHQLLVNGHARFEQTIIRLLDTMDFMSSVEGHYWVPNLAMRIDFNNCYSSKKHL